MSQTPEGLPVPDPFELQALFSAQFEEINGTTAPTVLAEEIKDTARLLQESSVTIYRCLEKS